MSYRKRRYQCKECGKTFYEKAHFLPKRARKTTRVTEFIVDRLKTKQSVKDIAKDANVSVNTVLRLLPPLAVSAKHLPEVLCIDEFKGKNKEIRSGIFWISMNTMKKRDKLMIE